MISTILGVLGCLHVTIMMTTVNFLLAFIFIGLSFTPFAIIPLLYGIWYWYDYNTPFQQGRHSNFIRNLSLWKHVANYFPIKLHKTSDLDPSKNYIFAFHPHVNVLVLKFKIVFSLFFFFRVYLYLEE